MLLSACDHPYFHILGVFAENDKTAFLCALSVTHMHTHSKSDNRSDQEIYKAHAARELKVLSHYIIENKHISTLQT